MNSELSDQAAAQLGRDVLAMVTVLAPRVPVPTSQELQQQIPEVIDRFPWLRSVAVCWQSGDHVELKVFEDEGRELLGHLCADPQRTLVAGKWLTAYRSGREIVLALNATSSRKPPQ